MAEGSFLIRSTQTLPKNVLKAVTTFVVSGGRREKEMAGGWLFAGGNFLKWRRKRMVLLLQAMCLKIQPKRGK